MAFPSATREADCPNPRRALFIVMNAGSGRHNAAATRQRLESLMHEHDHPHQVLSCRHPRHLPDLIEEAVRRAGECDGIVVAAGGDGTIRTVAQRVLAAGLPFGVLPMGTFNYFARDNDLPQDPVAAVEILMKSAQAGDERAVQVGQLNDRVFLVNASIGLYPRLLEDREQMKRRYGRSRLVALWAAVLSLAQRHADMLLRIEHCGGPGEHEADVLNACTLFVGNNALQLHDVGLLEAGEAAQQLEVLVMPSAPMFQHMMLALRAMAGRLSGSEKIVSFSCGRLIVEPLAGAQRRQVKVAMDGETTWMKPPLVFHVSPHPLRLVAPPREHAA
jgi:diacylglycerol kinase family enzyme